MTSFLEKINSNQQSAEPWPSWMKLQDYIQNSCDEFVFTYQFAN